MNSQADALKTGTVVVHMVIIYCYFEGYKNTMRQIFFFFSKRRHKVIRTQKWKKYVTSINTENKDEDSINNPFITKDLCKDCKAIRNAYNKKI